jgi:Flp pilus assembly protein TadB
LVGHIASRPAGQRMEAFQAWTEAWDNPAVNMFAACMIVTEEKNVQKAPVIGILRETLNDVSSVLSQARAQARGIEWQTKFLTLFPPAVILLVSLLVPDYALMYSRNPFLLLPVLIGSGLTYILTMKRLRQGLSVDASVGMLPARRGTFTAGLLFKKVGHPDDMDPGWVDKLVPK